MEMSFVRTVMLIRKDTGESKYRANPGEHCAHFALFSLIHHVWKEISPRPISGACILRFPAPLCGASPVRLRRRDTAINPGDGE